MKIGSIKIGPKILMCEALPAILKAVSVFGGVGVLVELVCCCIDFFIIFATLGVFFKSGCPSGSHVAPSGCLSGGIWPPSGSDLALLGSQGSSMGTPKGRYVGHVAPQGVGGTKGVTFGTMGEPWGPQGAKTRPWKGQNS